jgi:SAM-dependent methyltransferase
MIRLRSVLAVPQAYQLYWTLIGGAARSRVLVNEYVRPKPDDRILEIACGPGTIVPYLPQSGYVGFDANSYYIERARKRFTRAKFVCERVSEYSLPDKGSFDIVLALGIVHHLDDAEAAQLFRIAHQALKPGGKLFTLDGVWTDGQSAATRYLLAHDRGQFIRTEPQYMQLASQVFRECHASIRPDLLRIPYTHIILECVR